MHRTRDYDHYCSSSSSDDSSHKADRHHRWRNEREVSRRCNSHSDSPKSGNPRQRSNRLMDDRASSPQCSRHDRIAHHVGADCRDNDHGDERNYQTRDNRSHPRRNRSERSLSPRHQYRGDDYYPSETPLRGRCDRHQYDDSRGNHYRESSLRRSGRAHHESPPKYRDDYYHDRIDTPQQDRGDYRAYDYPRSYDPSPPRRGRRYESPHHYRDYEYYEYYDRSESPIRRWEDDRESRSYRSRDRSRSPSPYEERRRGEGYRRDPPRESFSDSYGRDSSSPSPVHRSPSPCEERRRGEGYRRDPPRESFSNSHGRDSSSPSPVRRSPSPYEERRDDGYSRYPREPVSDSCRRDARSPSSVRYSSSPYEEWKGKGHRQSSPRRSSNDPRRRNTFSPSSIRSQESNEYPSISHSQVRNDEGHHGSPPRSSHDHRRRAARSPSSSSTSNCNEVLKKVRKDERHHGLPPRSSHDHRRRATLSPSSSSTSNCNGYSSASSFSEEGAVEDYKRLSPRSSHDRPRGTRSPSSAHLQDIKNGYQSDASNSRSSVATSKPSQTCPTVKALPSASSTPSFKHIRATPDSVTNPREEDESFPLPPGVPTRHSEIHEEVIAPITHSSIEERVTILEDKMDSVLNRLQALDALNSTVQELTTKISKIEQLSSERTIILESIKGYPNSLPEAAKNHTSLVSVTPSQGKNIFCHGGERLGPFEPETPLVDGMVSNTSEQNQGNDLGSEEWVRP